MDFLLDRTLAAALGMAFTLCLLTALVVWWRILVFKPPLLKESTKATTSVPVASLDVKIIIVATGVAFLALALLFAAIGGARLSWFRWSSFDYDATQLGAVLAVIASALVAIRAATVAVCGEWALVVFGGLSAATGAAVFVWG